MLPCRPLLRCVSAFLCLSLVLASCNDDAEAQYLFKQVQQRNATPAWCQSSLQDDLKLFHKRHISSWIPLS
jgi:hypothetical protein